MAAVPASKEKNFPSCLQAEGQTQMGSTGWDVTSQWQWPLRPCTQGGLPHSQGMSRQPPRCSFITFALQERAHEPRYSRMFLDPAGKTPWAPTWIPGLGSQTGLCLLGSPNTGQPSNCLQRPPMAVFFLLPELALLSTPALGTPGAGPPPLTGAHGRCQVPSAR